MKRKKGKKRKRKKNVWPPKNTEVNHSHHIFIFITIIFFYFYDNSFSVKVQTAGALRENSQSRVVPVFAVQSHTLKLWTLPEDRELHDRTPTDRELLESR